MNNEFIKRLEYIESSIERTLSFTDKWKEYSFGKLPEGAGDMYLKCLLDPNKNLISQGGKRWRPLFATLVCDLVSGHDSDSKTPESLIYALVPVVEFVHTASLIHDDIEDGADLRRGKPCAHITYGLDTALNAASWFYFEAQSVIDTLSISDLQKLNLHQMVGQELRRLHLGQAMDIFWHRNPSVFPSEKEYEAMVRQKTGTLANLAAQLGALAGGADKNLSEKLGETASFIGMGFQIIDDVINLTTGNVGKKRGDDIVEGKKSLPVLIHVKKHPDDKEKIAAFMEQAQKEGIESSAVEECIALLESSGCIKEAWNEGVSVINSACEEFRKLGGEKGIKASELIKELFISMVPNL